MIRALLVTMLLAAAVTPAPAPALVVLDTAPSVCSSDANTLVRMPCARQALQLQTIRLALVKSFRPMDCRPVGVRLHLAGVPITPGRAAGLIATAVIHAQWRGAQVEESCQPTRW